MRLASEQGMGHGTRLACRPAPAHGLPATRHRAPLFRGSCTQAPLLRRFIGTAAGGVTGGGIASSPPAAEAPSDTVQAEQQQEQLTPPPTWDPEGLLPPAAPTLGGHFERRAAMRAAAAAAAAAGASSPAVPVTRPPPAPAPRTPTDGAASPAPALPTAASAPSSGAAVSAAAPGMDTKASPPPPSVGHPDSLPSATPVSAASMAAGYIPVDMSYPGLRLRHADPPVFTIDGFLSRQQCDDLTAAALGTGRLATSRIGAGNAGDAAPASTYVGLRRTSTSVLLEPLLLAAQPALAAAVASLQAQVQVLLPVQQAGQPAALAGGRSGQRGAAPAPGSCWATPGRMPAAGQFCFESPQVARYEAGQHFMDHEDAFPLATAHQQRFQRRATVLVYLNDVPQGGATHFSQLGLSVQPTAGTALLFFPASSDGTPDARTLHAAQDAIDSKVVFQQWVVCGMAPPPTRSVAAAATAGSSPAPAPPPATPAAPSAGKAAGGGGVGGSKGSRKSTARTGGVKGKGFG